MIPIKIQFLYPQPLSNLVIEFLNRYSFSNRAFNIKDDNRSLQEFQGKNSFLFFSHTPYIQVSHNLANFLHIFYGNKAIFSFWK